ncbi:hypothetical protein V6Z12_A07G126700 [Gossypium hirsutum]
MLSKDCMKVSPEDRAKTEDELPYSIALTAESSIIGKESIWYGSLKKKTMNQCYYTSEKATGNDGNCYTDLMTQKHRTMTEKEAKGIPIVQEIGDERQNSRDNEDILTPQKIPIIVKDKANKNQSGMVEIRIDKMGVEKFTEVIAATQVNHHRNSWRRLDKQGKFDVIISEMIWRKHKFIHEKQVDIDSYPTNENMNNRVKTNNGRVEGHTNIDAEQVV